MLIEIQWAVKDGKMIDVRTMNDLTRPWGSGDRDKRFFTLETREVEHPEFANLRDCSLAHGGDGVSKTQEMLGAEAEKAAAEAALPKAGDAALLAEVQKRGLTVKAVPIG